MRAATVAQQVKKLLGIPGSLTQMSGLKSPTLIPIQIPSNVPIRQQIADSFPQMTKI